MKNLSRRTFLKSASAATAGAIFIPSMISCSPNNKLKFAVIGIGGRGGANWNQIPKEDVVAICDVNEKEIEAHGAKFPNAKVYSDYRKLYDEMSNEFDAVLVSTPDHNHFPAAMVAMQLGKHIYVEKPLAHNIWQVRTLKKAAKHYGVVSQMGNQGHTTNGIRLVKEWYEAGVLGEVKEVHAWQGKTEFKPGAFWRLPDSYPPQKHKIPSYFDWDCWLGPAADRPFNRAYAPAAWRAWYDFGNGQLGDWACHTLDAPFWALDLGSPHTVVGEKRGERYDNNFVSEATKVTFEFGARGNKAPVTMTWAEDYPKLAVRPEWGIEELPWSGMIMIGDKNTLITGGRPNDARLLMPEEEYAEFLKNAPDKTIPRVKEERPVEEWTDAIRNNTLPGSNFDYAADLTEMALVGALAHRFGGKIDFDSKNMKITNRAEINAHVKEPMRDGWKYGEGLL